ncbi:microtubule-associated serine/threonine-protein kinase 2-like [Galendromus occidentalis]|uniref:non-specific serine/threonine protein kinase n=1 Tax=Galendromus occidentalis TaxID=34638 RepID=A0AAJ7L5G4_9ACAR|nr:microtubule-associated serine/threonine-protein kinase 2-like [Galendromus occidentalis]
MASQSASRHVSWHTSEKRRGTENVKLVSKFSNLTINAPEKETSGRELERRILCHLYSKIDRQNASLIHATYVAMSPFLEDVEFDTSMTPHEYFAMIQFTQSVREMRARMSKRLLDCEDVRDHFENLYCLYMDFVELDAFGAARRLAEDVSDLIRAMGEFIRMLEMLSEHHVTNWVRVAALLDRFDTKKDAPDSDYTPEISWFLPAEELLGIGGFGSVHRCRFQGVPVVSVELVERSRFKSESYSVAGKIVGAFLNSIHLCRSYASFATEDCYVSVLEYLEGIDLNRLIKGAGSIPIEFNRVISAQLCMALKYLHYKGFIHRDVKPANMMILGGCRLKLIDYDTVKICIGKFSTKARFKSFFRRTAREFYDKRAPGTVMFMPPEVLTGAAYGRALDWWAVGVTIYQLHFNAIPFDDPRLARVKLNIVDKDLEWPPHQEIPSDMADIVAGFLVKKPTDRLGSHSYSKIEKHRFFAPVDWNKWETGLGWMDWPLLDTFIASKGDILRQLEPAKLKKIVRLENQEPTAAHAALYTYFSSGYRRTLDKIRSGQALVGDEFDENLEVLRDHDQPYIFQKYVT